MKGKTMQKELTTEQKWANVDRIIANVDKRVEADEITALTPLESYLVEQFNK